MESEAWELLAQGAEAKVFLAKNLVPGETLSIVKDRIAKTYRHAELDKKLSRKRFRGEVKAMKRAAELTEQIHVPRVDSVDDKKQRIVMEFVSGQTTKQFFDTAAGKNEQQVFAIARRIGQSVAALHDAGMVHGDLTTSNLMIRENNNSNEGLLTVIDFGLAHFTKSLDDFAVDLYVLERAFLSTHPNSERVFDQVLDAYVRTCKLGEKVKAQFLEVQQRGRKKLAFG